MIEQNPTIIIIGMVVVLQLQLMPFRNNLVHCTEFLTLARLLDDIYVTLRRLVCLCQE